MLKESDAETLDRWATNLRRHGGDLSHWASPSVLADSMRVLAEKIRAEVAAR